MLCCAKSLQSARFLSPWNSPGKSTGVGCHFLLQCMKVKSESEVVQSCLTLATPWTAAHQAPPSMGFSRQEYWSEVTLPSLAVDLRHALQGFPGGSEGKASACNAGNQGLIPGS